MQKPKIFFLLFIGVSIIPSLSLAKPKVLYSYIRGQNNWRPPEFTIPTSPGRVTVYTAQFDSKGATGRIGDSTLERFDSKDEFYIKLYAKEIQKAIDAYRPAYVPMGDGASGYYADRYHYQLKVVYESQEDLNSLARSCTYLMMNMFHQDWLDP